MYQSPSSVGMVEVNLDGRAAQNRLVDGSVGSVLTIDLFIAGDVNCLAVTNVKCHFLIEG